MEQMTILRLFNVLKKEIDKGNGNKLIVISDDNEGNGYHGMFYGVTSDVNQIADIVYNSNGIYDSDSININDIVILG